MTPLTRIMNFDVRPHQELVEKPWGREIIYTPKDSPHTGKVLTIKAGKRLSLQYHDRKSEILCLVDGQAFIWLENDRGEIERVNMEQGKGYVVVPGQKHRLEAVSDALVIEVSDPESGNTFRISDDYARPDESEQLRSQANRGWLPPGPA